MKTMIVTDASRGIGKAIAITLAEPGMIVECMKCKKELEVPMGVYEIVVSESTWIDYSCAGTPWGFYKLPDQNTEPFKSLEVDHDGFCVSKHTGYFYCDRRCLQTSDDHLKADPLCEINEYWRSAVLKNKRIKSLDDFYGLGGYVWK